MKLRIYYFPNKYSDSNSCQMLPCNEIVLSERSKHSATTIAFFSAGDVDSSICCET